MKEREAVAKGAVSFVLRCVPRYKRGVGSPWGVPALCYKDRFYPAREVSLNLDRGLAGLGPGLIQQETLEELGIGALGRYIDGGGIREIALRNIDIFGVSEKTRGFWQGLHIDGPRWIENGLRTDIFSFHFEFLRRWGLPGGMVINWDAAAPLLLSYLRSLLLYSEKIKILVLMSKEHYAAGIFPASMPLNRLDGGLSLFAPQFRGTGICFYDEIPENSAMLKASADILFLVEPPPRPEVLDALRALRAGLVVGVGEKLSCAENLSLFGIRGKLREYTDCLFRVDGVPCAFPKTRGESGWKILFPPRPFGAPPGTMAGIYAESPVADTYSEAEQPLSVRFTVLSRFKKLKVPEYKNEQLCFRMKGKAFPFVPFAAESGAALKFEKLSPGRRAYFLFWRDEFRRGKFLETDTGYITLYTRELILFVDGDPMDNFRELQKLWHGYRADFPILDRLFPLWLMDFGVLYNRAGEAFAELLPFAPESGLTLLVNEYIHRKYIAPAKARQDDQAPEEVCHLSLEDVFTLIRPDNSRAPQRPELAVRALAEKAFRGIDRFLIKQYGKGLFDFFYPSRSRRVEVRAFEGLSGLGESSYQYEGIDFCGHTVFIDFFKQSLAYIEYGLGREQGIARGREPPLDGLWKFLIHRISGFGGSVVPPPELRLKTIHLESETLDQLRLESESLRELLRPLDEDDEE
ncbi:MAG: TerB N-terminal domain-containing protein, partial [Spirochaetaceae bacterium]|nr:TerB N-terminal domain-containing protein [Spirochaetaceae bacterium]